MQVEYKMKDGRTIYMPGTANEIMRMGTAMGWKIVQLRVFMPSFHMRGGLTEEDEIEIQRAEAEIRAEQAITSMMRESYDDFPQDCRGYMDEEE